MKHKSDGSTASYYELPSDAEQLQDLISHKNMNAQIGEIFRACYRYAWTGHIHHKQAHEIGGLLHESWNVLPPTDSYHSEHLYGSIGS